MKTANLAVSFVRIFRPPCNAQALDRQLLVDAPDLQRRSVHSPLTN
jgi:hypothetical protein